MAGIVAIGGYVPYYRLSRTDIARAWGKGRASGEKEEGGRIMSDVTDRDPQEIKVGMAVEMTFRKLRSAGGIHDYGWKCRPSRGTSDKEKA